MEVLTTTEMERADRLTIAAGTPGFALMMSAGQAVAEAAMNLVEEGPIVVVAGGGNNGGDGFVAAAELAARGRDVSVILRRWRRAAGNIRCCRSIRRRSASRR
jgi:ADP-dependent NAD(P)H-hydrate dehydratase / NAD(P)H-hydrate epimerase